MRRKAFFDFEFTGLHQNTTPISLGITTNEDEVFYAEFSDYDRGQITPWIKQHVIDNLRPSDKMTIVGNRAEIANELGTWLILQCQGQGIEMWSDCLSYNWMLFCELFGGALNLPDCIFYIPYDICTLFKIAGIDPDINREAFVKDFIISDEYAQKHNALWDARIIKRCYDHLSMRIYWGAGLSSDEEYKMQLRSEA